MSERKEKIKSIAIVFLSIMLVLTFFSNTIMNYSLVEVSTQGVYGGSITTKVRGSGTVQAAEAVSVEAASGRKIATINVKTGAEVEEGDVLFTLGAGDSDELAAAKDAYESAKTAYDIAILQSGISVSERLIIETGSFGSLTDRQNTLVGEQDKIDELQKQYDEMTEDITAKKTARDSAQAALDKAISDKEAATTEEDKAKAQEIINKKTKEIDDINYYLGELGWKYEEVKKQLKEAEESIGDAAEYIQQITLHEQYEELCELKEKVDELAGKGGDKEIKAPMGFLKSAKVESFVIKSGETTVVTVQETPKRIEPKLLIEKVDAETGKNIPQGSGSLQGAQFEMSYYPNVYQSEEEIAMAKTAPLKKWLLQTGADGTVWLDEAHWVSGDAIWQHFPLGTLTIQEKKASNGYHLNPKMFVVPLRAGDVEVPAIKVMESCIKLELIKYRKDTKEVLAGAQFEHICPNGSSKPYTTDHDGRIS